MTCAVDASTMPLTDLLVACTAAAALIARPFTVYVLIGATVLIAIRSRPRRIVVTDHDIRILTRRRLGPDRLLSSLPRRTQLVSTHQISPWRETPWGSWVPGPWLRRTTVRSDVTTPPLFVSAAEARKLREADAAVGLRDPVAGTDPVTRRTIARRMERGSASALAQMAPEPVHHLILGAGGPLATQFVSNAMGPVALFVGVLASWTFGAALDRILVLVFATAVAIRLLSTACNGLLWPILYAFTNEEVVAFRCHRSATATEIGRSRRTVRLGPLLDQTTRVPFDPPSYVLHTFAGVAAEADAELDARESRDLGFSVRWTRPDGSP